MVNLGGALIIKKKNYLYFTTSFTMIQKIETLRKNTKKENQKDKKKLTRLEAKVNNL